MKRAIYILLIPILFAGCSKKNITEPQTAIVTINWEQLNYPYPGFVKDIAIDSIGALYVSTPDQGIYFSSDLGENWLNRNVGLPGQYVANLAISDSQSIFAFVELSSIYRSTNFGMTWSSSIQGRAFHNMICLRGGLLIAGTYGGDGGGIFRSTDNGRSWNQVVSDPGILFNTDVADSTGSVLIGTSNGIYKSIDRGSTWTQSIGILQDEFLTSSTYSEKYGTFVGSNSIGSDTAKIFRSTDDGSTWKVVNPGMAAASIEALLAVPNGDIYAGTWGKGVFRSTDGGQTWIAEQNGLTDMYISSIALDKNGILFVGTYSNWVFRTTKSVLGKTIAN
jgi:photosystem II stability/assembly factor-like uncharacterized protein